MTFEEMFQLDPRIWPLAVMAFLRVVTIFVWLPVIGDMSIPKTVRIGLALLFTLCLWPQVEHSIRVHGSTLQWSPIALLICTLRETLFGFAVAFSARMAVYAASIGAQLVGVNMGFQTASLFNQSTGTQESAFAVLQGWLVLLVILGMNMHHVYLEGIAKSFLLVPIGPSPHSGEVLRSAGLVVSQSFILGLKLAAPLLVVQILITIALGCLSRAIPQLNVFLLNFPISFLLSMMVLFVGAGMYVRYLSLQAMPRQAGVYSTMQKSFSDQTKAPAP